MRTEQQIKRKRNDLLRQKSMLEARRSDSVTEAAKERTDRELAHLDDMIVLLEWILNEPSGSYHM